MNTLGLIPARGGSKGISGKNVRLMAGKPLIAWTIEVAKTCHYLDRLIVSTDDEEIAAVARQYGAETPFMRPRELASDAASSEGVFLHAIDWFEKQGMFYDTFVVLQPTSPLRTLEDLNNAFTRFIELHAGAVVSVCEVNHHPYHCNMLPADLNMKHFFTEHVETQNRQALQVFYRLNGAIYLADVSYFRQRGHFYGDETYAYIMPQERSVDIDTLLDFEFAELLLKKRHVHIPSEER